MRTKDENFGNGRDIRTLYQRTIERQSLRLKASPNADLSVIEATDVLPMSEGRRGNFDRLLAKLDVNGPQFGPGFGVHNCTPVHKLDGMIGLAGVKAKVKRLINTRLLGQIFVSLGKAFWWSRRRWRSR